MQMTLDHFGRPISYYLYQCFGFFSAAEGFFFLSGFVGMLAAKSKAQKDPGQSWMRKRALRIWVYHMLTLAAMSAIGFAGVPVLASYFKALYEHPLQASLWASLMVYTPMWLDVLPLYVIFLIVGSLAFRFFARAKSKTAVFLLWLPSLLLWLLAQFDLRAFVNSLFPVWIHHGTFDPFGWQFAYFTGAATIAWWRLAREQDPEVHGRWNAVRLVKLSTPLLGVVFVFCMLWSHGFIALPQPADFLLSREHLGILRFANFYVFMLLVCAVVRFRQKWLDFGPLNTIGRHSLDVYTAHIVLIYMWFSVVPNSVRYHLPWNVVIPLAVCVCLWGIAKLREKK